MYESQKHLGVIIHKHLNLHEHIERKIKVFNKLIGTIKHLSVHLPGKSLLTIYKSFVRPHLDYGGIIYDNPVNESLINKLEKVQCQASLAITGDILYVRVFIRNLDLNLYKVVRDIGK